jgi:hypothetical protein
MGIGMKLCDLNSYNQSLICILHSFIVKGGRGAALQHPLSPDLEFGRAVPTRPALFLALSLEGKDVA